MNYISIRQILDDLLADDMMKGLSLERAVNYAVEFTRIVGMPKAFEEKIADIEIEDYRGVLPCDFFEEIQVKDPKGPEFISMETAFHSKVGYTYKIQGDVIITSIKCGTLKLAYRAIKVDKDGYPLIPDNGTFARALELYIQKRYFTILFNNSKLPLNVLQNVQQEYAFYVGQAQSDLVRPSLDQMQSISNMWTSLIQRDLKHADGFATMNLPELRKF